MTLNDAQQQLRDDAATVAEYRACADDLKKSIGQERSRENRQVLAGKLEALEEQQLDASNKEAASDSRVRQLKMELFNLQHSRFLVTSKLDALNPPPPIAITITRERLAVALDVEPAIPSITGIKSTRPPPAAAAAAAAAAALTCTLCRCAMRLPSVLHRLWSLVSAGCR
jgi:hypothetical protein